MLVEQAFQVPVSAFGLTQDFTALTVTHLQRPSRGLPLEIDLAIAGKRERVRRFDPDRFLHRLFKPCPGQPPDPPFCPVEFAIGQTPERPPT